MQFKFLLLTYFFYPISSYLHWLSVWQPRQMTDGLAPWRCSLYQHPTSLNTCQPTKLPIRQMPSTGIPSPDFSPFHPFQKRAEGTGRRKPQLFYQPSTPALQCSTTGFKYAVVSSVCRMQTGPMRKSCSGLAVQENRLVEELLGREDQCLLWEWDREGSQGIVSQVALT